MSRYDLIMDRDPPTDKSAEDDENEKKHLEENIFLKEAWEHFEFLSHGPGFHKNQGCRGAGKQPSIPVI
jgi:hypothetical protein